MSMVSIYISLSDPFSCIYLYTALFHIFPNPFFSCMHDKFPSLFAFLFPSSSSSLIFFFPVSISISSSNPDSDPGSVFKI